MADIQVTLDGNTYSILETNYEHRYRKFYRSDRSVTQKLTRTETSRFANFYRITLKCACANVATLATSYSKSASTGGSANRLDFIDIEGNHWNPASAGGGILNTGVYFNQDLVIRPRLVSGFGLLTVDIDLEVAATQMGAS